MIQKPFVCLITGPAGTGKSYVSSELWAKYVETVRISI